MENKQEIIELEVPNAPSIPGLRFRRCLGYSDYPAMVALLNRCNQADGIDEVEDIEAFTSFYKNMKNVDKVKDLYVAEIDGEMVGFGRTGWAEIPAENQINYRSFFWVDPIWRNKGLGHAVFPILLARCNELAAEHSNEHLKHYQTFCAKSQESKIKLIEEFSFSPSRYFFSMKRDLHQPIQAQPLPQGLELRRVEPDHMERIFWALDEAFRDHWGHEDATEKDFQDWLKRAQTLPQRDPSIWVVAWDGDEVAGMVLNAVFAEENKVLARKWGWTDPICVRRPWRKRGLASALIMHSLVMFKDMGMDTAALGVDSNNPNGALGIYERCGFEAYQQFIAWEKPIG
jgi:GNAT superfamily N-acetyltransferase